jgi:hypothetical protein
MKSPLIHGCFDETTLETLQSLQVETLAFDLRAKSKNLIPFSKLLNLLDRLSPREVVLMFENDRPSTIFSFLDLLKSSPHQFILEFRDLQSADFYFSLGRRFIWKFHPEGQWQEIMQIRKLEALLLPRKYETFYQSNPKFWKLAEERELSIFLHEGHLSANLAAQMEQDLKLSLDLGAEVERSYRQVDQEKLRQLILR